MPTSLALHISSLRRWEKIILIVLFSGFLFIWFAVITMSQTRDSGASLNPHIDIEPGYIEPIPINMKDIIRQIEYPQELIKSGIEGMVQVLIHVDEHDIMYPIKPCGVHTNNLAKQ